MESLGPRQRSHPSFGYVYELPTDLSQLTWACATHQEQGIAAPAMNMYTRRINPPVEAEPETANDEESPDTPEEPPEAGPSNAGLESAGSGRRSSKRKVSRQPLNSG